MRQTRVMGFAQSLFLFFVLFGFIFSPRLNVGVVIHVGIFSVFLFALAFTFKQRRFALPKPLFYFAVIFLSLANYHLLLATFLGNNPIYFFSICISSIVYVTFGWIVASFLDERGINDSALIDHLIMLCAIAIFVNSAIIIVEHLSPEIKTSLESLLLNSEDANVNYAAHPFMLRGLSSAGGAALSIVNALAVLLFIFLVVNKKISNGAALFGSLIIVISNIFVARSGLILGVLFFVVLAITLLTRSLRSGVYGIMRAGALILSLLIALMFILDYELDPEAAGWAFEWVPGLLSGKLESESSDDLISMLFLPDNPLHLLFGIGFFEGESNLYSRSDSGYLKTIFSIGMPLAFLLYSVIIFLFSRLLKVSPKYRWLVVSITAFALIVEIKEPFLYQNYAARIIFLLSGAAMFVLSQHRKHRS
jgi:hypothetical protein